MSLKMKTIDEKYTNQLFSNQYYLTIQTLASSNKSFLDEMRRKICEEYRDVLPVSDIQFEEKHFLSMAEKFQEIKNFFDSNILVEDKKFHSDRIIKLIKEEYVIRKDIYESEKFQSLYSLINDCLYKIVESFCKMMIIDEAEFIFYQKVAFDCNMENKFVIINSFLNRSVFCNRTSSEIYHIIRYNSTWARNIELKFSHISSRPYEFKYLKELVSWNIRQSYPEYEKVMDKMKLLEKYLFNINMILAVKF